MLSLAVLVLTGFCTNAAADNIVSMENLSIKPGETKTVAVNLENSDNISALQMDITLPYGLVYEEASVTRNEARLDRDTHSIYMQQQSGGTEGNTYRLLIVPSSLSNIMGNEGAVAYFKVTAYESFTKPEKIYIRNIVGSNTEKDEETGFAKKIEIDDYAVTATPYVGKLYFSVDTTSIKPDGSERKLSLILDNYVDVRGMQADITLPSGLAISTKENGNLKFDYGQRLPQNVTISTNVTTEGKTRVIVSGITSDTFAGETGEVFSFYIKGGDELALKSEITISNAFVSDNTEYANSFVIDDVRNIEITNSFLAHYTPACDSIAALRKRYDEAVKNIEENYAEVKDNEDIVSAKAAIAAMIDELQESVDKAYADETLAPKYDEVMAPAAEIMARIEKLLEDAAAAQDARLANEEAYKRLTEEIAALQTKYDEAKEKIDTDCKDVADRFTETEAEIQEMIDVLTENVKTLYEAVELTAESTIDTSEIEEAIERLIADAIKAQEEFTSGVSAITGNEGSEVEGIYTVSGNRVNAKAKGQINIVKYSDGTVKKYYVK